MHETGKYLDYIKAPDTYGRLSVEPKESYINTKADWMFKLNPLVIICLGNQNLFSAVAKDSRTNSYWIELQVTKDQDEDKLIIEFWNFCDFGTNDILGTGYIFP